jgi:hypothetical protein
VPEGLIERSISDCGVRRPDERLGAAMLAMGDESQGPVPAPRPLGAQRHFMVTGEIGQAAASGKCALAPKGEEKALK